MQRPAAFVHCMPLCLALSLSLLLSALLCASLSPLSLALLLRLTCTLSCAAAAASQRQKLSTICLGTCVFYFALHLTTAHAALSRRRCCLLLLPQLPPSAVQLSLLPLASSSLPLLPAVLLLLQFFIFHFIFRSFNFYLCK